MDRAALERLDRDSLIDKALEAGVPRARILTRPELIDELLMRQTAGNARAARKARGFFGLARDLLARVIERGLHLPDAADLVRGEPIPPMRAAPTALPTVTLAEIYAAQGHRDRAIETLKKVLDREPDHAAARAMLATLEDEGYDGPPPRLPPEEEEAAATATATAATTAPATTTATAIPLYAATDECVAIPEGDQALFVYWGVRRETMRRFGEGEDVVVRVLVVEATWDGPRASHRDHEARGGMGHLVVRDLPKGAVCRVAVGRLRAGTFVPVAHSSAFDRHAGAIARWTPAGHEPVRDDDDDAPSVRRARARMEEAR
jgi:hypothetical protein